MRALLIFILLIAWGSAEAQKASGFIKLLDNDSALAGAEIRNLKTGQTTFSSANGFYEIQVRAGEELQVRLLSFQTKVVKLTTLPEERLTIYLKKQVNELEEVSVTGLSVYQQDSITRREAYEKILSRNPNRISAVPDSMFTIITAVGPQRIFSFPGILSRILEKKVGKGKKAYKFQDKFNDWEQEQFKDFIYNKTLVQQLTGLTDEEVVVNFMNSYPIPYLFARTASKIELNSWIKTNYADWRQKGSPVLIK